jgi:hypothetical protein
MDGWRRRKEKSVLGKPGLAGGKPRRGDCDLASGAVGRIDARGATDGQSTGARQLPTLN